MIGTLTVGTVSELDVIERELLTLADDAPHQTVDCLHRRQRTVLVLGIKLPTTTTTDASLTVGQGGATAG